MDVKASQQIQRQYLAATAIMDRDHPDVVAYARAKTAGAGDSHRQQAIRLFYAVRDDIRYDPYSPFYKPEHYRASNVLNRGRGYCVAKAALLTTLARACGIPSRIGFATVRNHLATRQLIEFFGSDLFVYHGYTEFYLDGGWIKATPTFNIELCRRHRVNPLDFDGRRDAIFHPFNQRQQKYMEYVAFHGTYADVPVERIVSAWRTTYGPKRVQGWIEALERSGGQSFRRFEQESPI